MVSVLGDGVRGDCWLEGTLARALQHLDTKISAYTQIAQYGCLLSLALDRTRPKEVGYICGFQRGDRAHTQRHPHLHSQSVKDKACRSSSPPAVLLSQAFTMIRLPGAGAASLVDPRLQATRSGPSTQQTASHHAPPHSLLPWTAKTSCALFSPATLLSRKPPSLHPSHTYRSLKLTPQHPLQV